MNIRGIAKGVQKGCTRRLYAAHATDWTASHAYLRIFQRSYRWCLFIHNCFLIKRAPIFVSQQQSY